MYVEQTNIAPEKGEEARCVEDIDTYRGGWYCGHRYDAGTRRQVEAAEVYAEKGVGVHLTVNLICVLFVSEVNVVIPL